MGLTFVVLVIAVVLALPTYSTLKNLTNTSDNTTHVAALNMSATPTDDLNSTPLSNPNNITNTTASYFVNSTNTTASSVANPTNTTSVNETNTTLEAYSQNMTANATTLNLTTNVTAPAENGAEECSISVVNKEAFLPDEPIVIEITSCEEPELEITDPSGHTVTHFVGDTISEIDKGVFELRYLQKSDISLGKYIVYVKAGNQTYRAGFSVLQEASKPTGYHLVVNSTRQNYLWNDSIIIDIWHFVDGNLVTNDISLLLTDPTGNTTTHILPESETGHYILNLTRKSKVLLGTYFIKALALDSDKNVMEASTSVDISAPSLGIQASLTTDKQEYSLGEQVKFILVAEAYGEQIKDALAVIEVLDPNSLRELVFPSLRGGIYSGFFSPRYSTGSYNAKAFLKRGEALVTANTSFSVVKGNHTLAVESSSPIAPLPFKAVLKSDSITEVSGDFRGGIEKILLNDAEDSPIAEFEVNLDSGFSTDGIIAATDWNSGKAFIHIPEWRNDISGPKKLYIPARRESGEVYICPEASSFAEVNLGCPDLYFLSGLAIQDGYYVVNVSGTGGAEGTNANLTIWDDTNDAEGENVIHGTSEQVGFYANFTNSTLDSINGTGIWCNISFNLSGSWQDEDQMTFNETSALYEYNRTFSSSGTFYFRVVCNGSAGGYEELNTTDDFIINNAPTHDIPIVNATTKLNSTDDNLTCYNQSTNDSDGEDVKNIYNWYKEGTSLAMLNLPFEGGSTSTWTKDYTNYGNNGTVVSAVWNSTGGYDGKGAYEFDGVANGVNTDHLEVDGDLTGDLNLSNGSLLLWIKPDEFKSDDGQNKDILQPSDGEGLEIALSDDCGASGDSLFIWPEKGAPGNDWQALAAIDYGTVASQGEWAHVAITWYRNSATDFNISFYINATEYAPCCYFDCWGGDGRWDALPEAPPTWYIGYQPSHTDRAFNGVMDEIMMFDYQLSAEQVEAIFNNQSNLIVSQETGIGENWTCCVTPNDGVQDGVEKCSDDIYPLWVDYYLPNVYLEYPPNNTMNQTDRTPDFIFNATDENSSTLNCTLWLQNSTGDVSSYGNDDSVSNDTSTTITATSNIPNGEYLWWINCSDGTNTNISEKRNLTIYVFAPTHDTPILNSTYGTNFTDENLTVYNQSTNDQNGQEVKNIINWYKDGKSLAMVNLPFEGGSNSTWTKDYTNYSNNGTVYGAEWQPGGGYDGKGAYYFDGVANGANGDHIYFNGNPDGDYNLSHGSFLAWVKVDEHRSDDGQNKDLFEPAGGDKGIEISFSEDCGGDSLFFTGEKHDDWNTYAVMKYSDYANKGEWAHVGVTWAWNSSADNDVKFYINGDSKPLCGSALGNWDDIMPNPGNWSIGLDPSEPAKVFNGSIDEVLFFNYTLSAEQVEAIYLNQTDVIVSQETEVAEVWKGCVTPNDGHEDGIEKCSNSLTIESHIPAINLEYPLNNTVNKTSTPYFTFNVSNDEDTNLNCTLWLENSTGSASTYGNNDSVVEETSTTITVDSALIHGEYLWWINCSDDYGFNISEKRNLTIDPYLNISLNLPPNGSSTEYRYQELNVSYISYGPDDDGTVYIYAGNDSTNLEQNLVYIGTSVDGGSNVTYNFSAPVTQPDDNTVMLLHFDTRTDYGENSTHVYDFSGNGNNATAVSGKEPELRTTGKIAGAFKYSNDAAFYIQGSNAAGHSLDLIDTFSIVAWVNNYDDDGTILGKRDGGTTQWQFYRSADRLWLRNDTSFVVTAGNLPNNEWAHIAATVNGSGFVKLYINGELEGYHASYEAGQLGFEHENVRVSIGARWNGYPNTAYLWHGLLDEIVIYNRTLNDSEILDMSRLPIGTYYWMANGTNGPNWNDSQTWQFNISADLTPPTINLVYPANDTTNTTDNTPEFIFNVTDAISPTFDCTLWLQKQGGSERAYGNDPSVDNSVDTTITANQTLSNGDYLWWINCTDESSNSNISEKRNITINVPDTTPPEVYLEMPANDTTNTTDRIIEFRFNASDDIAATLNCTLWIEDSLGSAEEYGNIPAHLSGTSTTITANASLPDDVYLWWVNCSDTQNTNISKKRTLTVNLSSFFLIDVTTSKYYHNLNISENVNLTHNTTTWDGTPLPNVNITTDIIRGNTTYAWWNTSWHYRVPLTIAVNESSNRSVYDYPVELYLNFTEIMDEFVGPEGKELDNKSIRVVKAVSTEYSNVSQTEIPSIFVESGNYHNKTNAYGELVFTHTDTVNLTQNITYHIYFDTNESPKTAPTYVTDLNYTFEDLDWSASLTRNFTIQNSKYKMTLNCGNGTWSYANYTGWVTWYNKLRGYTHGVTASSNNQIADIELLDYGFVGNNIVDSDVILVEDNPVRTVFNFTGLLVGATKEADTYITFTTYHDIGYVRRQAYVVPNETSTNKGPWFFDFDIMIAGRVGGGNTRTVLGNTTIIGPYYEYGWYYPEYSGSNPTFNEPWKASYDLGRDCGFGHIFMKHYDEGNFARTRVSSDDSPERYSPKYYLNSVINYTANEWNEVLDESFIMLDSDSHVPVRDAYYAERHPPIIEVGGLEQHVNRSSGTSNSSGLWSFTWNTTDHLVGVYTAVGLGSKQDYSNSTNYQWFELVAVVPNVTLIHPENESSFINRTVNFGFNATDDVDLELNCDLFVDEAIKVYDIKAPNSTLTTANVSNLSAGWHTWKVRCENDYGARAYSDIWMFYIIKKVTLEVHKYVNFSSSRRYNITINMTNFGEDSSFLIYDFIPGNFTAYSFTREVDGSSLVSGDYTGNATYWNITLSTLESIEIKYLVNATGQFKVGDLFMVGADPPHDIT